MCLPVVGADLVVAITGGMGTGKSSVARFLCAISGATGFDADAVCRGLLAPEAPGWLALRGAFGEKFFLADQTVDRPLLRKTLFADQGFRKNVNVLLHPLVRLQISADIRERVESSPGSRIVVEVPLLYEAGWQADYSRVVVVYADTAVCRRRIMLRDRTGQEEAEQAMGAQLPLADKVLLADHVIDNSGGWEDTCLQVHHLSAILWPESSGKNVHI
jgi:dephospho-CoA kinase